MLFLRFLAENARWLAVGLLLMLFSSFGQTYFISLFAGDIRAAYDLSHGDFGGLYMFATLLSAATLTAVGKVVDVYAVATVVTGVVLGLALFCVGMAATASVWMLFAVIFGLRLFGQGMMTHVAMTAMGRWYSAQRGQAVSLSALGLQIGEAILPILFVTLIAWAGWRSGWWVAAGILVVLALPLLLWLLRIERTPRAKAVMGAPEIGRQWSRREVLGDPAFWVMSLGTLAPAFIGTTIYFHQIYLIELRGWTRELFAAAFIASSSMTLVFALLTGWAIDRFSALRILPFFLLPLTAACLVLASVTEPAAVFVFMALLGISNGVSSTLFGALWPEIYGTRHLGAVRSVVVAMMVLASALGPGLTGWLIDRGVAYEAQIVTMALYCLVVSGLMGLVSIRVSRRLVTAEA